MCTLETLMIKFKVVKVSLLNDAARVESLTVVVPVPDRLL